MKSRFLRCLKTGKIQFQNKRRKPFLAFLELRLCVSIAKLREHFENLYVHVVAYALSCHFEICIPNVVAFTLLLCRANQLQRLMYVTWRWTLLEMSFGWFNLSISNGSRNRLSAYRTILIRFDAAHELFLYNEISFALGSFMQLDIIGEWFAPRTQYQVNIDARYELPPRSHTNHVLVDEVETTVLETKFKQCNR